MGAPSFTRRAAGPRSRSMTAACARSADAGGLHGCTEVAEPPGRLAGGDEPMQMAALHADIPDAAHLTSEDRLEKLLQTFPLAGAVGPEETGEPPIALRRS